MRSLKTDFAIKKPDPITFPFAWPDLLVHLVLVSSAVRTHFDRRLVSLPPAAHTAAQTERVPQNPDRNGRQPGRSCSGIHHQKFSVVRRLVHSVHAKREHRSDHVLSNPQRSPT